MAMIENKCDCYVGLSKTWCMVFRVQGSNLGQCLMYLFIFPFGGCHIFVSKIIMHRSVAKIEHFLFFKQEFFLRKNLSRHLGS